MPKTHRYGPPALPVRRVSSSWISGPVLCLRGRQQSLHVQHLDGSPHAKAVGSCHNPVKVFVQSEEDPRRGEWPRNRTLKPYWQVTWLTPILFLIDMGCLPRWMVWLVLEILSTGSSTFCNDWAGYGYNRFIVGSVLGVEGSFWGLLCCRPWHAHWAWPRRRPCNWLPSTQAAHGDPLHHRSVSVAAHSQSSGFPEALGSAGTDCL